MKAITTASLTTTMMLLAVADSWIPTTSNAVTAPIAHMAGTFATPWPTISPPCITATPGAAVSSGGISMPMSCSRLTA